MAKLVIVDDDQVVRQAFTEIFKKSGIPAVAVSSGKHALELFRHDPPSVVLLDLRMPGMDGIETLRKMKQINRNIPVIMMTAYSDTTAVMEAIRIGAYDFIVKPPKIDRLILTIRRAIEHYERALHSDGQENPFSTYPAGLHGDSQAIKRVLERIHQVAQSDFSVIIQGETGTGKSVVARTIHTQSKRAQGPFVTIDSGALPDDDIEGELFGQEESTSAEEAGIRTGFAAAQGGSIFIDCVESISLKVQAKLLKAVEEKRFFPVGAKQALSIDARIISATHCDMKQLIAEKKFREDLYFNIGVFIITLPPLRERSEDIPAISRAFFREAGEELQKEIREVDESAITSLMRHSWPGNLAELKNTVKRAVLLAEEGVVRPEHIDFKGRCT